jgi:hypothetical protein
LGEFEKLKEKYPLHIYKWGIAYNTIYPLPVIISAWNHGVRIMMKNFYPHKDDAANFHLGNVVSVLFVIFILFLFIF